MADFTNGGFESGLTGWSTAKHTGGDDWGEATTTGTTYSEGSNSCRLSLPDHDSSIIIYQTIDLTNATGISFDYQMGAWATGASNWLGVEVQIWNVGWGDYAPVWESVFESECPTTWTATCKELSGYTGSCTVRVWARWYTPI